MASFGSRPFLLETWSGAMQSITAGRTPTALASCVPNFVAFDGIGGGAHRVRLPEVSAGRDALAVRKSGRSVVAAASKGGSLEGESAGDEDGILSGGKNDLTLDTLDKRKKVATMQQDLLRQIMGGRNLISSLESDSVESGNVKLTSGESEETSAISPSVNNGRAEGRFSGKTDSYDSIHSAENSEIGLTGNSPGGTKTFAFAPLTPETSEISSIRDEDLEEPSEARVDSSDAEAIADPQEVNEKPPPLAGENVMNILVATAECEPWAKTGGLADVAGALPKALARRGHRVMVVTPRYGNYAEPKETGVRKRYKVDGQDMEVTYYHAYIDGVDYVFIDNPVFHHRENNIYGGDRLDVLKRMVLFCKAAVEVPWHVPCGGVCYGDGNLAFIANDWHTALLPVYLKAYYRDNGLMKYARSVLVIHNIAHQGRGPVDDFFHIDLPDYYIDLFKLYDPVGGDHFNIFAAGLKCADRIVTVSHGYSWELKTSEGGWGLHEIINENSWKFQGIVNGINVKDWNPELDTFLESDGYTNYSLETLDVGKPECKAALQRELNLPVRGDVPVIAFIGRLDPQKGVDLIGEAMHWIAGQDVQVVMLGTGRPDLEDMLKKFDAQYHNKVRAWVGFSVKMAHRITAGADILLMPSRFEPCGLNQLYAMKYGTIPVVHAVGGLRDTVTPFDPFKETGTGWTFDRAETNKLINALGNCLNTYWNHKDSWKGLQKRGMEQDLSWENAAERYEEVVVAAKYQW